MKNHQLISTKGKDKVQFTLKKSAFFWQIGPFHLNHIYVYFDFLRLNDDKCPGLKMTAVFLLEGVCEENVRRQRFPGGWLHLLLTKSPPEGR